MLRSFENEKGFEGVWGKNRKCEKVYKGRLKNLCDFPPLKKCNFLLNFQIFLRYFSTIKKVRNYQTPIQNFLVVFSTTQVPIFLLYFKNLTNKTGRRYPKNNWWCKICQMTEQITD